MLATRLLRKLVQGGGMLVGYVDRTSWGVPFPSSPAPAFIKKRVGILSSPKDNPQMFPRKNRCPGRFMGDIPDEPIEKLAQDGGMLVGTVDRS